MRGPGGFLEKDGNAGPWGLSQKELPCWTLAHHGLGGETWGFGDPEGCLLYTSDAADDWLVV